MAGILTNIAASYRIRTGKPAIEVDIGAALAAKRVGITLGIPAAIGAFNRFAQRLDLVGRPGHFRPG